MLSILIDPARLGTAANLYTEVEAFINWFKASPPDAHAGPVQIAGEPELRTMRQRLAAGIPIDANSWEEILAAGTRAGLARAAAVQLAGL
jgi:uncharacterized oxidoreductase